MLRSLFRFNDSNGHRNYLGCDRGSGSIENSLPRGKDHGVPTTAFWFGFVSVLGLPCLASEPFRHPSVRYC